MKLIGLTGGIASGKSTAAEIFKELGFSVLIADQLARKVVEKGQPAHTEIVQTFGPQILDPAGEIDRKKLAELVFSNRELLQKLNAITHPRVAALAAEEIQKRESMGVNTLIYEVPLLFETDMQGMFDAVILIAVPPEVQLRRLLDRNPQMTEEEAKSRIASQMPLEEKIKLADVVIDNSKDIEYLKKQIEKTVKELRLTP